MSRTSRPVLLSLALALVAAIGFAPPAPAAELFDGRLASSAAKKRRCHAGLTSGAGVVQRRVRATAPSLLRARLRGARGDWDLAVFDSKGRLRAASAATGTRELAEGFVYAGGLTVQACRRSGAGRAARLTVDAAKLPSPGKTRTVASMLEVRVGGQHDKTKLEQLGLDLTEHGDHDSMDVVAYGARDLAKLRAAGFSFRVRIPDLAAQEARNQRRNARFAGRTERSSLPSGRDDYRRLADYEADMKALAEANPALVKLITLPHASIEGRPIMGLEITSNVEARDGKPVFLQIGAHHAREWPSSEHAMEWAFELVNGYGKDSVITDLVNRTRTVVVPLQNPDGFNLSREAEVDLGFLAQGDPYVNPFLQAAQEGQEAPVDSPGLIAAILFDQEAGFFAYKRRNCRMVDYNEEETGYQPVDVPCGDGDARLLGTDTNRNYGGFWGGPGAESDPTSDTFRGMTPNSEPEVENIRHVVSTKQVTTLITNHTFSNLILHAPGLRREGLAPDEDVLHALGAEMAAENGYANIYGWQLYDTTGTTEDWSYYATGGLGYTFEIGPEQFHPPFEDVIAEYEGNTGIARGGNRAAYLRAQASTANPGRHSVISGQATPGTTLRLHKSFDSWTSSVIGLDGIVGQAQSFRDTLETTMTPGGDGRFEWHVNPSTRPFAKRDHRFSTSGPTPFHTEDISSPTQPPLLPRDIPIRTPEDRPTGVLSAAIDVGQNDDYDLYLYEGEPGPNNRVASGTNGFVGSDDTLTYVDPKPGQLYTLRVVNYAAVGPYTGKYELFPPGEGTIFLPAQQEAWTLSCERGGEVLASRQVEVERGQSVDVGTLCGASQTSTSRPTTAPVTVSGGVRSTRLRYAYEVDRRRIGRALRHGLRARVRCSAACRPAVALTVAPKVAKRYRLRSTVVARGGSRLSKSGRRTFRVRFTRDARRKLRRAKKVELRLLALTTDVASGRRAVARKRYELYR